MFNSQLIERKKFKYPPFYRLIKFSLKHKETELLNMAAAELSQSLRFVFDKRVLGPEYPLVSRVKNLYIKDVLLKLERDTNLQKAKEQIQFAIDKLKKNEKYSQLRIVIDVDPY